MPPRQPSWARRGLRSIILVALIVIAAMAVFGPTPVAAQAVTWQSYDVTLTLNEDGTFHVVERQTVDFEGGPFSFAYAEIPLSRVDDITDISVGEARGGELVPYERSSSKRSETFSVQRSSSTLRVIWYMPRTTDEQRTFVLEYEVVGGLRVYGSPPDQRQQIWWTAIGPEVTETAPIESATFTIVLPRSVQLEDVVLDGPGSADPGEHTVDGRVFTWSRQNMRSGEALEARLEFPALASATAPAWQEADDEQRLREQDRDSRHALLKLMMAAAGFLALTAGGVGLYGLWYARGRDPGVGEVASYLSEPPDDLPPGAAGALVDEFVNERDIVATLVDLGRRGVLDIRERSEGALFKRRDYMIELKESRAELRPFERAFVTAIVGSDKPGRAVQLGEARERFNRQVATIKSQMYEELVKRGYFTVSPHATRSKYQSFASGALVGGAVILAIFGGRLLGISGWILLPMIAIGLLLLALHQVAQHMPRKTVSGAEAAAKWRAFKRYLSDLDQDRATEGAGELFEKYLPYAVAFGLERSWVNRFAEAGAPAPEWYGGSGGGGWFEPRTGRYPGQRGGGWGGWGGWGAFPSAGGGGSRGGGGSIDFPDLPSPQEASDRGAKSLQSLSGGLFELFDVAGSTFDSFGGGGRHGGFSGGGRSFGGGGGGGRSGGGGGGGRGFG